MEWQYQTGGGKAEAHIEVMRKHLYIAEVFFNIKSREAENISRSRSQRNILDKESSMPEMRHGVPAKLMSACKAGQLCMAYRGILSGGRKTKNGQ